jgi:HAD superfamily hydrolase (TIGR01662 family)
MKDYQLIIFDADGTLTPLRGSATGPFAFVTLPGVRETCAQLREQGITLAIASNQSPKRHTRVIMEQLTWTCGAIGIKNLKDLYLMWATGGARKPSPHMLLALMKRYNATPANTLFVGDWETDKQAAEAAGVDFEWAKDFFSMYVPPSMYVPLQKRLSDELAVELAHLSGQDQARWIAYLMECLDAECGDGVLEIAEALINERFEKGQW